MKINDINRAGSINPYRKNNEAAAGHQLRSKNAAKDEVQISAEAKEMLETHAASSQERARRIEELKRSVQAGTYHVPAKQIAEKLLRYLVKLE